LSQLQLPPGYRLERLLGRSALSEVFLVTCPNGEPRALKLLRPSACRDPRLITRFGREAQLLEDLRHPNLVQGFGSIVVEGRPGLLLEYVDGPTLRDAAQAGPLGWEQVARYGVQLARALDRLHRHGALHRDVKPHNVLIDAERGAVLADLGLVRRNEDPELTRHGAALGSPAYMSPEQARDPSGVGPEADVYSLGATLHHALSGSPPFLGKGVGEVIHRVLHMDPEPLPISVPEPLKRVLATALAKDPERRYARARDLSADLGRVLLGEAPRLLTRHRRKRRLQTAVAAALTPLVLTVIWFGGKAFLAANHGESTLPSATEIEANEGGPGESGGNAAASEVGVRSQRELYETWAQESLHRVRRAYEEGAYRMAWQSLELFEQSSLPNGAERGFFEQLRRSELQRQRARLEQRAAEVFVDVAEVLQARSDHAREEIRAGNFEVTIWRSETLLVLEDRVPRVRQLPLFPGGDNPMELLQSYQLTLERQNREAWVSRANTLLPDLRNRVADGLRDGQLDTAWALWVQVDTRLLDHSLLARREGWRMERLFEAERALAAAMSMRLGRPWSVPLREGRVSGRVSLPAEGGSIWRIDPGDGPRVEVRLLALEPSSLREVLELTATDADWLAAQLWWIHGEVARAVDAMRRLALRAWSAEADPYFWSAEWERELALQPGSPPSAPQISSHLPVNDPDGQGDQVPVAANTLERYAAELRAELIGAEVTVLDSGVALVWRDFDAYPSWLQSWSRDLRRWQLASWEMQWELPLSARLPETLQIWGDVRFLRQGSAWELQVGGKRTPGVVLVPGARQTLAWNGKDIRFDSFDVGKWQAPNGRRLLLRAEASSSFVVRELKVVLRPVRP
jgi:eukaryotic-like serine/threonine-protein kinase